MRGERKEGEREKEDWNEGLPESSCLGNETRLWPIRACIGVYLIQWDYLDMVKCIVEHLVLMDYIHSYWNALYRSWYYTGIA